MARIVVARGRRPQRGRSRAVALRAPRTFATFTGTVTNAGNAPTDAIIEVAGPTTGGGFFVTNATEGKTLRVNYTVASGQTLVIDLATRTATVGGTAVAGIFDHANSQWWQLAAGANTIQASVAATVKHRNAYR